MKPRNCKRAGSNQLPASSEQVVVGGSLPSGVAAIGLNSTALNSYGLEQLEVAEGESVESSLDGAEQESVPIEPVGPSETAQRVRRLQQAVLDAAARRKRLPQPLFWSLFHTELEEIRRTKERKRILSKLLS